MEKAEKYLTEFRKKVNASSDMGLIDSYGYYMAIPQIVRTWDEEQAILILRDEMLNRMRRKG